MTNCAVAYLHEKNQLGLVYQTCRIVGAQLVYYQRFRFKDLDDDHW